MSRSQSPIGRVNLSEVCTQSLWALDMVRSQSPIRRVNLSEPKIEAYLLKKIATPVAIPYSSGQPFGATG